VLAIWISVVLGACSSGDGKRDKEVEAAFTALVEQVKHTDADRRRSAVRGLAAFGTEAAWRVVLEALADEESAVADAAQVALARIADPRVATLLFSELGLESREDVVALRAAEALGRLAAPIDAERLVRELSARDAPRSRTLLWSIERLAERQRVVGNVERILQAVQRVESSRLDVELSCAALLAWSRLDPVAARPRVLDALRDRAPERRCAAALVLARTRAAEAYPAGVVLAADPDARVRMRGVECLDAVGTKAAMLSLVVRLGEEQRLRVRWRIVDALQDASGLKNKLDPRPWKLWAEQLPEGGVIRRGPKPGERELAQNATRAEGLAGLPIVSDRVAFLFDFSGSMWTAIPDGRLPKDIVAEKLRLALEALTDETQFNLIPYTNEPLPWEDEVQPAKKQNVARALEFFGSCRARGRGNVYDAALLALEDEKVDSLVVLTDGVPTGGVHSDMDLIAPLLLERLRFRPAVIDAILVDAPGPAVRRWRDLSAATGGRSIEVELRAAAK
jgi:HEAT repeat protein